MHLPARLPCIFGCAAMDSLPHYLLCPHLFPTPLPDPRHPILLPPAPHVAGSGELAARRLLLRDRPVPV
eukprot:12351947-Heterocapsa_arctica.AAC.1